MDGTRLTITKGKARLGKTSQLPARASTLNGLFRRVVAYWHIGREIVEHEQGGRRRAAYGETVLDELSRRLTAEFGRGFDVTNLRKMRQFYRMYEIRDALRLESGRVKRDAARRENQARGGAERSGDFLVSPDEQ